MEEDKRQRPRRGEYCGRPSRQARLRTRNERIENLAMEQVDAYSDGLPQYSPRRPFLPLRTCIHEPSSSGRHPPLGGGRMLARFPFSKSLSTISRPSAPSTIISEESKKSGEAAPGGVLRSAVAAGATPHRNEQTPLCPMPSLTLRRCVPMADPMASRQHGQRRRPRARGLRRCPNDGHLSHSGFRASAESCTALSQRFIFRNRKNLQRVRKDGCPAPGASVLAHIGA